MSGPCSLYMDRPLGDPVEAGDWVATRAGSRYLVLTARLVRRRDPAAWPRYQLMCERMPHGEAAPDGVVVHWLRWYPRARRR